MLLKRSTHHEPLRGCAHEGEGIARDERQHRNVGGIEHPDIAWLHDAGAFDPVLQDAIGGDDADVVSGADVTQVPEERVAMARKPCVAVLARPGRAGDVPDGEAQRARVAPGTYDGRHR
jgi:hypothetical protein